jgi:protocatechuate 3,4-dioxygenase beta subunit
MSKPWKLLLVLAVLALVAGILMNVRPKVAPAVPAQTGPAAPGEKSAQPEHERAAPAQLEGAQDPAARSRAEPSAQGNATLARVRLRLVDEATREPVPFLAAELHNQVETLERMQSDARGYLRSTGEFPAGEYVLDLSSERHEGDLIQTRAKETRAIASELPLVLAASDENAPVPDLAIPAGPTFTFQAAWPRGLSPASFTALLSGADSRLAFDRLFAPLCDGTPVWTRFSPLARLMGGGPPFLLRVTSDDALWFASASVERLEGRAKAPIELVFEGRARLVGRVLDPGGKPVANEWLQAWPPGASLESTTRRPLLLTTKEDGAYDLRAAEPGRYTLKLEGKGFLPYAEELDLPALTRVEHDIRLARPDPSQLAPIRGRVTSRSGSYEQPLLVLLTPEAPPRNGQVAHVEWSGEAGAKSGRFEFKGLMPGDYTLELRPGDLVRVEPRKLVVRPSQKTLEFAVQDSGARADLHVRVVADEDGSTLKAFRLSASVQGSEDHTTLVPKSTETETVLRGAPVGSTLDLRVEMQGRQMLWTSLVVAEKPEPLVLKLKQGWGAELTVTGPKLEPLAGASVFLDEELAGLTDAHGTLRAVLPQVPRKCRIEYKDWKLAPSSEVSPETGQFRTSQGSIQVRMEPAK